jgi:hypothetical protein
MLARIGATRHGQNVRLVDQTVRRELQNHLSLHARMSRSQHSRTVMVTVTLGLGKILRAAEVAMTNNAAADDHPSKANNLINRITMFFNTNKLREYLI